MTEASIVTTALNSVVQEIRISSLTKHVRPFHGEGTAKFYQWLTDMDQLSNTVDSDRMCVLATLTLGGPAGLFVARLTKTHVSWTELREKLRKRYGETEDSRISKEKIRHIKQNKGEAVHNFAERLRAAAADMFSDIDSPDAQDVLTDTFQRGLRDDRLARTLIRKNCKTLDELEHEAEQETRTDKIFSLYRRDEEPMDVDIVKKDEVEELRKKVTDLEKKLEQRNTTQNRGQTQRQNRPRATTTRPPVPPPPPHMYAPTQPRPPPPHMYVPTQPPVPPPPPHMYNMPPPPQPHRHKWTRDGRPICSVCGRIGHTSRFCRAEN